MQEKKLQAYITSSVYEICKINNIVNTQAMILLSRIYTFNRNGKSCYESQETLKSFIAKDSRYTVWRMINKIKNLIRVKRRKIFPSTNEYMIREDVLSKMIELDKKENRKEIKNKSNDDEESMLFLRNPKTLKESKNNEIWTSMRKLCNTAGETDGIIMFRKIWIDKTYYFANEKKSSGSLSSKLIFSVLNYVEKHLKEKRQNINNCFEWFKSSFYSNIVNRLDDKDLDLFLKTVGEIDESSIPKVEILINEKAGSKLDSMEKNWLDRFIDGLNKL